MARRVEPGSGPSAQQLLSWGLDPAWSRRVTFTGALGESIDWHVLDTGAAPRGTIVCVHGNPSWGYLWREALVALSPEWRVIAVDQTGMGYSGRPGPRRLAQRIDELVRFCAHEAPGPIVLVAHDWGGPVAVGASAALDVRALILSNTALALPPDVAVPPLIAAARSLTRLACRVTPAFVDGAAAMTDRVHREALRAPYRSISRRRAVADFVADIPVRSTDPSYDALARAATTFDGLTCPILLLWGGRDPVFHDRFLRDLRRRAPNANVERFAHAGHFLPLDEPIGPIIRDWLEHALRRPTTSPAASVDEIPFRSVLDDLAARSGDSSFVYEGPDGSLTWGDLAARSTTAASALAEAGVTRGDRIGLLVPPSVELLVATLATWKVGAVAVAVDSSAGIGALRRLVRAAAPTLVIGTPTTVAAAHLGRFAPGARLAAFARLAGVVDLRRARGALEPVTLRRDDAAALVHTSGATGAAKPVRYSHGAIVAQRGAVEQLWRRASGTSFTTSFGAFMLLAPALGARCVRPDFDVDRPAELTFDILAAAARSVDAAWLSPAAARRVVATAQGRRLALPLVMLAGAPISASLARQIGEITGGDVRAPYGMTECLPVTDGSNPQRTGPRAGTCTGTALAGAAVVITGLDDVNGADLADGSWGEILVSEPWMFDGYDAHWSTDEVTTIWRSGRRFHRTGDVGYLWHGDLFQLGRAGHVIHTARGPLASVAIEEPVADALTCRVAALAVGPPGASVVALVLEDRRDLTLAPAELAERARAAAPCPVAAVLIGPLPTDRRHQSKLDRTELARSVGTVLAGR